MDKIPEITIFPDGTKIWEHTFEKFHVKVYLPLTDLPADIINFGFLAPYLMIFEERRETIQGAKRFAEERGFDRIASSYGGSVAFFYPADEGGWEKAPADLYESIMAESRISQYYQDGTATLYDRFAKKMGKIYIRGAVPRAFLYGFGASADYIARNCLKTIEGDGLYGKGDITPAGCVLRGLSVVPHPERRDIPVLSVGDSFEVNQVLQDSLDYVMVKKETDTYYDFKRFLGKFRRMAGNLEQEPDFEEMGMAFEPGCCTVETSPDNRGDDRDTREHRIGYIAYYNKGIMDEGAKVPLLLCFHGGGDSAACMVAVSGWYRVAARHDFLLVSVENHLDSTATETVALIEHLKEKYSIDSERVYASGFSMGGCKTWDMMQEYPKLFAAVAPMDATFDVGLNSYGEEAPALNQETILPVFYVGGEITPLPELPFQEEKCLNRMGYVLKVNRARARYDVKFDEQDKWENPIWGISGDHTCELKNPVRENSVLTLQLFVSEDGHYYSVFGSVSNQGHEVRHHSCENAWKFMNCFRRLPDGTLEGGEAEKVLKLFHGV